MAHRGYRRPLTDEEQVERFLGKALKMTDYEPEELSQIVKAEILLEKLEARPTITHKSYRNKNYRENEQRDVLCTKILHELIELERLPDDDKISLGMGGAKPSSINAGSEAYIVSGAPASGKSTIAVALADKHGAYILDSDYAKRKLPEYAAYESGASLVHKESDEIIFAGKDCLYNYCEQRKYNVVIPMVGKTTDSVKDILVRLQKGGYTVHFVTMALDRRLATIRTYLRYRESRRYVPLAMVFDEVANEPERVYYEVKRLYGRGRHKMVESFALLSTDVARGEPPEVLECTSKSPIAILSGI